MKLSIIIEDIMMWFIILCLYHLTVSNAFNLGAPVSVSLVGRPLIARNKRTSIVSKPSFGRQPESSLALSDTVEEEIDGNFDPKAWINPNTRGGVIVWS